MLACFERCLCRARERITEQQPRHVWVCRQITAPTLILKQDDQGKTRAQNIAVAERLRHPLSKLVHVKGAGHNVRRDQKERALAELLPFLASV